MSDTPRAPGLPSARDFSHGFFLERYSVAKTDHCDSCDGLMSDVAARDAATRLKTAAIMSCGRSAPAPSWPALR